MRKSLTSHSAQVPQIGEAMRGAAGECWSRVSNARPRVRLARVGASAPGGRLWTSSTSVFQPPQAGHRPDHLVWAPPQDWQT